MDVTLMMVIGLVAVGGAAFFVMKKAKDKKNKTPVDVVPAPAPAPTPAPEPMPGAIEPPFVALTVVRGAARFAPRQPLAADWMPSFHAAVMYGTYIPNGPVCEEDRIARPPGARSPRGYPMWDGKVMFCGEMFEHDGAVAEYVAVVAARDEALADWQRRFSAVRYIGSSGIDAATVAENRDETKYLWDARAGFVGDLHRAVLSGANVDMSRCINNGFYGAGSVNGGVRPALVAAVDAALARQAAGLPPVYTLAD